MLLDLRPEGSLGPHEWRSGEVVHRLAECAPHKLHHMALDATRRFFSVLASSCRGHLHSCAISAALIAGAAGTPGMFPEESQTVGVATQHPK